MKRTFLAVVFALVAMVASAQTRSTKVVTDSVAFMPNKVQIFEGVTKNGNPKFWIEIPADGGVKKVSLSQSHATSGRLLALIERRDTQTGRYSYSVKFAESRSRSASSGKADLSALK